MPNTTLMTLAQGVQPLPEQHFAELEADLQGRLLRPGSHAYEAARTVWNAMIDRRPALIARCEDVEDVRAALRFARETGALT